MSDPDGVTNDSPVAVSGSADISSTTASVSAEASDRAPRAADAPRAEAASTELTYDDIAARAYDLWTRRGHAPGGDFEDWVQAESELRQERQRH